MPNPTEQWIRKGLYSLLKKLQGIHSDLHGVTGMALGVDTIFAEVCIELKIPFTASVPFIGQEASWPEASQFRYLEIISYAEKSVVVDEIPAYKSESVAGKLFYRNLWMVDHSKMTIAVWDGSAGGTAHAVGASQKVRDRKTLRMDPLLKTITNLEPLHEPFIFDDGD